jgi:osmotically-inducible protein OsmY
MRSDGDIKRDVEDDLRYDPDLDATDITVSVKDGVVALGGFVKSYVQKLKAEAVAKHVAGVLGLASDTEVRLPEIDERPDPAIAREAAANLRALLPFSVEHIKAIVTEGWLTLDGEVQRSYERDYAEQAVRRIRGLKGTSNLIRLASQVELTEIERTIEEAFRRSAELDANRITVEANGSEVVLKGTVHSWIDVRRRSASPEQLFSTP